MPAGHLGLHWDFFGLERLFNRASSGTAGENCYSDLRPPSAEPVATAGAVVKLVVRAIDNVGAWGAVLAALTANQTNDQLSEARRRLAQNLLSSGPRLRFVGDP